MWFKPKSNDFSSHLSLLLAQKWRNKTSLEKCASELKIHTKISKRQSLDILDKHSKILPASNLETYSSAIVWSVYHWKVNLSCNCNHIHSCRKATAYIISAAEAMLRHSRTRSRSSDWNVLQITSHNLSAQPKPFFSSQFVQPYWNRKNNGDHLVFKLRAHLSVFSKEHFYHHFSWFNVNTFSLA